MKTKKPTQLYSLRVDNKSIVLTIDKTKGKALTISTSSKVEPRVVLPLPDIDKLMARIKSLASKGYADGTINGNLNKYIRDRENDIDKQIQEIRRSFKRIEKLIQCIDLLENHMKRNKV
jgi:hypothetical protein